MWKKLVSILFLVVILPLLSANGIAIISNETLINKTYNVDTSINLIVRNEEPFSFYNITFQESWITTPKFNLNSGENVTITATIKKNEPFEGQIHLIGEYYTNIGISNITKNVEVDYTNSRISPCNLNLVIGDYINWSNLHYDSIKLMNTQGNEIGMIQGNSNLNKKFDSPINFNYYASWIGFQFTQICNINIMNSEGYVHNSGYDGLLDLKINMIYEPTIIETIFYETNYRLEYSDEKEDVFRIKNIGTKTAKRIHLSGEWFEFPNNDFDLGIGDSINVPYRINPYILETNQTNKNYTKIMKIEGNFNAVEKNFTIFIPYSKVTAIFSGDVDKDVIIEFFKYFCKEDEDTCVDLFCSVYPEACSGLMSDKNITQSFSSSTLKELIEGYAKLMESNGKGQRTQIETDTTQTNEIEGMKNNLNETLNELKILREESNSKSIINIFLIVFVLFIICCFVLYIIYTKEVSVNIIKKKLNFHRGEHV